MPKLGLNMNWAEAFIVSPETGKPPGPRLVNCTLGDAVNGSISPEPPSAAAFCRSLRVNCAHIDMSCASAAGRK